MICLNLGIYMLSGFYLYNMDKNLYLLIELKPP
jgi:hypothetical protein